MENASKALIIAGGVFIALFVITILVFFFQNVKIMQSEQEAADSIEQAAEFNKQYDVYNRNNIYGSEILSLANKMENYNQKEAEEKGYLEIGMQVNITQDIGTYFKKGNYVASDLQKALANLEQKVEEYANVSYCGKRISDLSSMRTNELQELFRSQNKLAQLSEAQAVMTKYTTLKAEQTEIKSRTFRCVEVENDPQTGRITFMKFELVG